MRSIITPRLTGAQPLDLLETRLRAGRATTLTALLPLETPAPPNTIEFDRAHLMKPREIAAARRQLARREFNFPGLILGDAIEQAKYCVPWPPEDAPLAELVGRYLLHIRGKWSVEAGARCDLQFVDYIREYVAGQRPGGFYERGGRYNVALDLLRVASGLPRYPATLAGRK